MPQKIKLILDTDIGSEMTDAAALTLAAISLEIDLLSVTTVTGNSVFRASVARKILDMLGKPEVPVSPGYGDGSEVEHAWEKRIIFPDGYRASNRLDVRPAWQMILDSVNSARSETAIACIGPLTNLARALYKDPNLPNKVSCLLLMGGMINQPIVGGHQIPRGFEYNFCQDSEALQSVIRAGFDITILPGDLTFQDNSWWLEEDLKIMAGSKNPTLRLLKQLNDASVLEMAKNMEAKNMSIEFARPWVNDEFLMAYIIRPDLFEVKEDRFDIEMPDKYPRFIPSPSGCLIKILSSTNFTQTRSFILDRLTSLG